MALDEWWRAQTWQSLVLWTAALVAVVLALADVPVLGLDAATLAVLGAVFAALTSVYTTGAGA